MPDIDDIWDDEEDRLPYVRDEAPSRTVSEATPSSSPAPADLTETANGTVQDCLTAIRDLASEMGHSDTLGFEEARERIIEHVEEGFRRLLSASPTPTAQPTSILWCAHVQGPDEVHPARDYDHAVEMCNMFNAISEQCNFGFKPDDMRYVRSVAYPAIWPWDAASHAEGLPSAPSAGEATKP